MLTGGTIGEPKRGNENLKDEEEVLRKNSRGGSLQRVTGVTELGSVGTVDFKNPPTQEVARNIKVQVHTIGSIPSAAHYPFAAKLGKP